MCKVEVDDVSRYHSLEVVKTRCEWQHQARKVSEQN